MLFVVLACAFNLFYLVNSAVFPLEDINLIVILVWALFELLSKSKIIKTRTYLYFSCYFICSCVLVLCSSIQSHNLYLQPIWYGIRAQRYALVYPFLLFIILSLVDGNKISISEIKGVLFLFCSILLFVGFLQQFLYEDKVFTFVYTNGGSRYGNYIKLGFDVDLLIITSFFALNNFSKSNNPLNLVYLLLVFCFLLFVEQSRMMVVAFGLSVVISYFFFLKGSYRQKSIMAVLFLFVFIVFCFSDMASDLFSSLISGDFGTSEIRKEGRSFYFDTLKSYFLGGGFINTDWDLSVTGAKFDIGYFVVDNGVFGYFFTYGWPGILSFIILYFFSFKKAIRVCKFGDFSFLGYLLFAILASFTVASMGMTQSISMWVFLSLMIDECNGQEKLSQLDCDESIYQRDFYESIAR
jgi:hypothetical protein